jgi:hypothetical protein
MRISRVAALTLLSVVAAAFVACSSPAADPGDATPVPGEEPALVEVTAPIESVVVNIAESFPPQYFLVIQAGLSNGCIQQGSYDWKLDGDTVTVDVTVLAPVAGSLTPCTDDYRVVEKTVALGSDFEPGTTYTVNVNDKTTSFTTEDTVAQMVAAPAPIDGLTINIAESFPPQYMLVIESGLPNGCATFGAYDVKRDGDTVSVSVTNNVPADQNTPCDMSYGTVETTVNLGSDFEPGAEYTVLVNDKSTTFTAQGEAVQMVEEDAPVESVTIVYAPNGESRLVLTTGLPSGCHEIVEPLVLRADDTIIVEVQNLVEVGAACTDDYRVVESRLPIPGEVEACATYDINVNGVVSSAQAIGPNIRCSAPDPVETPAGEDEMKMVEAVAPIDGVAINVAESFPLQYFVAVTSGLPSGCAKFGGYAVDRDGTTIRVTVTNLVPADKEIACTAIYGIVETSIPLGSAFDPDTTYTVIVNDDTKASFTTDSSAPGAQSGSVEVKIDLGDTVDGGSEDLRIGFLDVTEDSRCPANVVCVWAGRANVLMGVVAGASVPMFYEVQFGGGAEGDGSVTAGDHTIKIVALDPYPGTVTLAEGERPAYVLTVEVTKDSN